MNNQLPLIGKTVAGYQIQHKRKNFDPLVPFFEAIHRNNRETVWIVGYPPELLAQTKVADAIDQEIQRCLAIHHPNWLKLLDVIDDAESEFKFLIYELYSRSRELASLRGQLLLNEPMLLFQGLLDLLEIAHQHEICGWLEPRQIFVRRQLGEVDFRWFRPPGKYHRHLMRSMIGMEKGDYFGYMSPESLSGSAPTPANDFFALGIILFETLAGQRAFVGHTDLDIIDMLTAGHTPPIERTNIAPPLKALIIELMHRDPTLRLTDFSEIKRRLAQTDTPPHITSTRRSQSAPSQPTPPIQQQSDDIISSLVIRKTKLFPESIASDEKHSLLQDLDLFGQDLFGGGGLDLGSQKISAPDTPTATEPSPEAEDQDEFARRPAPLSDNQGEISTPLSLSEQNIDKKTKISPTVRGGKSESTALPPDKGETLGSILPPPPSMGAVFGGLIGHYGETLGSIPPPPSLPMRDKELESITPSPPPPPPSPAPMPFPPKGKKLDLFAPPAIPLADPSLSISTTSDDIPAHPPAKKPQRARSALAKSPIPPIYTEPPTPELAPAAPEPPTTKSAAAPAPPAPEPASAAAPAPPAPEPISARRPLSEAFEPHEPSDLSRDSLPTSTSSRSMLRWRRQQKKSDFDTDIFVSEQSLVEVKDQPVLSELAEDAAQGAMPSESQLSDRADLLQLESEDTGESYLKYALASSGPGFGSSEDKTVTWAEKKEIEQEASYVTDDALFIAEVKTKKQVEQQTTLIMGKIEYDKAQYWPEELELEKELESGKIDILISDRDMSSAKQEQTKEKKTRHRKSKRASSPPAPNKDLKAEAEEELLEIISKGESTLTLQPTDALEREVKILRRKGVVRAYTQMNPGKIFPLLVSIIEAELYIKLPDIPTVQQIESDRVMEIKETSPMVRIVPVLPGCIISPPEAVVDVRKPKIDTEFWIAPQSEGDLRRSARIQIWHEGILKDEISIPCRVRKQTLTRIASYSSVFSSLTGAILETYGKDLTETSGKGDASSILSIALHQLVTLLSSSGLWLGLFFLLSALLCYLWLKPKRGDDIEKFLSTDLH